jgi:acetolactate synthase-1/2/3 large subunit
MNNEGYGTIKNSQRRSFNGNFLGCNAETGLWLPNWLEIAKSFGLPHFLLSKINFDPEKVTNLLAYKGPQIIEVQLDPDQDYFPKLLSKKDSNNMVVSMPLHEMHPKLDDDLWAKVYKWK